MSTITDPIADLLARVRNGAQAQKPELFVPYSKIKAEIARILKDEGQIKLEIATRYFGQGGEQSRLTGAGGGNAERESIARAFARAPQQHGAGGKRGI